MLTDINMPGISGFDLVRKLKEDDSTQGITAILLLTPANLKDAVEIRNRLHEDRPKRRSPENIGPEGYWLAVRRDLLDHAEHLDDLRGRIASVDPKGTNGHDNDHRQRLVDLTSLRLLDMVAWWAAVR